MKFLLQILFLLLTWFANLANATPAFTKFALPNYEFTYSITENVKDESVVKIGVQNFARSGICENYFFQKTFSWECYALEYTLHEKKDKDVKGAGDAIPNLLNKIDNVIDDVGNASLQVADVTDEIVKGSNSLSDAAKKFWANLEVNCTKYLRETYGYANVGRQITVDVTLSNGQVVTCRIDNLVKQGNTYKIIDAKSSIINNLSAKNVDELISQYATTNQKTFYDALKNGQVQKIVPRGQRAVDYFSNFGGIPPNGIGIGNQVEFLVNDVATDGYNIYKKVFGF
jgi:hypothetical protein